VHVRTNQGFPEEIPRWATLLRVANIVGMRDGISRVRCTILRDYQVEVFENNGKGLVHVSK
jgi:hypothetical protein